MKKFLIPAGILGVIAIGVIVFLTSQQSNTPQVVQTPQVQMEPSPTTTSTISATQSQYKDGTYNADGNYVSPGGPRDIGVTIVLTNGVITDAIFEGRATDPTSKRFQGEFAGGFKEMVVGKNIDEVNLTKVAGSSLTPKGFNDALQKIKSEAAS